jgi:hypothetical protein
LLVVNEMQPAGGVWKRHGQKASAKSLRHLAGEAASPGDAARAISVQAAVKPDVA